MQEYRDYPVDGSGADMSMNFYPNIGAPNGEYPYIGFRNVMGGGGAEPADIPVPPNAALYGAPVLPPMKMFGLELGTIGTIALMGLAAYLGYYIATH